MVSESESQTKGLPKGGRFQWFARHSWWSLIHYYLLALHRLPPLLRASFLGYYLRRSALQKPSCGLVSALVSGEELQNEGIKSEGFSESVTRDGWFVQSFSHS